MNDLANLIQSILQLITELKTLHAEDPAPPTEKLTVYQMLVGFSLGSAYVKKPTWAQ